MAPVILEQHKPAQLRPEVAADPGQHAVPRWSAPPRGQPTLAAEADHVRAQHQALNQEVFGVAEAGADGAVRL